MAPGSHFENVIDVFRQPKLVACQYTIVDVNMGAL
jgi:hypothetical protein